MVFPVLGANTESAAYEIDNSLRTGGGDNHHLSMVYSSAASDANRRTFTFSGWIKLGQAAHFTEYYPNEKYLLTSTDRAQSTTNVGYGGYTSGNAGSFHFQDGRSGTYIETTTKFRDPNAWYHVVVKYDSTQSTASDRIFIYVNGVSQPLNYSNSGDPEVDLNTTVDFFLAGDNIDATSADNGNFVHNVNGYYNSSSATTANHAFDGHFADMYLLDGQALAPTAFAKTNSNGVWVPKKYTGTFNSHSFHLEFKQTGSSANSSGMGADTSGQDNHFKVGVNSTLAAVDITTDTPTNNFARLNPLSEISTGVDFSEGNTRASIGAGSTERCVGNMGFTSGKWYYEVKYISTSASASYLEVGFVNTNISMRYHVRGSDGERWDNGSPSSSTSYRHDPGDIIGVYIDADNKKWYIQVNGSNEDVGNGTADVSAGTGFVHQNFAVTDFILPYFANASGSGGHVFEVNFGNAPFSISSSNADANGYGSFEYNPTNDGVDFYALCTKNLAEYG